jgi:hypothetical protein
LAIALAAGIKGYLDWAQTRPVALHKALPELQAALDGAHWVSPGLAPASTSRRTLYMVSFRTCPYCIDYEQTEFPKLQKAGVDTRVILIARRDAEGHSRSTPAERATVAELWRGRQWSLYQRWLAMPAAAWSSSDQVPPLADNDPARAADVEADRQAVERIAAVLSENGVDLHYPALIYQDAAGHWRGFIGYDPKAASAIRADLGVS